MTTTEKLEIIIERVVRRVLKEELTTVVTITESMRGGVKMPAYGQPAYVPPAYAPPEPLYESNPIAESFSKRVAGPNKTKAVAAQPAQPAPSMMTNIFSEVLNSNPNLFQEPM